MTTEPRWLPTEAEIVALIAQQRTERRNQSMRVNDGPQTILMPRRPMTKDGRFIDSFDFEDVPEAEGNYRFWRGMLIASAVSSALWLVVLIGWLARGN
jgi:hypothetical protein